MVRLTKPLFFLTSSAFALIASGCASITDHGQDQERAQSSEQPQFLSLKKAVDVRPSAQEKENAQPTSDKPDEANETNPIGGEGPKSFTDRSQLSQIPSLADKVQARALDDAKPPPFGSERIDARVNPLPLPAFIDVVFGNMLAVPYTTGPGISNRSEVVQLRSSGEMKAATFLDLVSMALRDYGVRVTINNGIYQIVEDQALKARTPQFIKSRARQSTPANLRPVVQFVELNAINANDMLAILRQALGRTNDKLSYDAATDTNFITLTGLPDDFQRYSPAYWNARELQRELQNILEAEGWQASITAKSPKTILMLSVQYSNDLMIFTRSKEARKRVNYWLEELDQPTPQGDVPELFVYDVLNLDANILAQTVNQVLSGRGQGPGGAGRPGGVLTGQGIGAGGSFGTQGQFGGSTDQTAQSGLPTNNSNNIVVDNIGNRLVYSGTASDYQRLLPLLKQLDNPPAEVLIEVTIADISLNSGLSFGVDWNVSNLGDPSASPRQGLRESTRPGAGGSQGSNGTNLFDNFTGALASGGGGSIASAANNNIQASLNAAANNGDIRILSTPRIITRSGNAAQIQVGSDVPVISSQGAADVQLGNGLLGLTSIEYRSTGILLSIEPIVYGNNRIDLSVSQELSNSTAGTIAGIPSPTFSNTSVSTSLSLEDGATAVIGGLIQETQDITHSGIPFLKDVPIIGNLFSSTSEDTSKREVVLLITAYVLQGQNDKDAIVNEFSRSFNKTTQRSDLITLRPRQF